MMKLMTRLMMLALATSLTACNRGVTKEQRAEREEQRYRKAMAEYEAGDLTKAVDELLGVLRDNPGNLSARFLVATLQQERKDNLGAFCNFREFLQLAPDGEKAAMARSRLALCEEQVAREFAKKLNLTDNAEIVREGETVRKHLRTSEAAVTRLEKELAEAQRRAETLTRENARLRRMVSGIAGEDAPAVAPKKPVTTRALLDDEDEETSKPVTTSVAAAEPEENADLKAGIADAKSLLADADEAAAAPFAPAAPSADGKAPTHASDDLLAALGPERKKDKPHVEPPHEERPEYYVIAEGDSLMRIALRFYGTKSAWRKIQAANKAIIPLSGDVKVGQRIKLP